MKSYLYKTLTTLYILHIGLLTWGQSKHPSSFNEDAQLLNYISSNCELFSQKKETSKPSQLKKDMRDIAENVLLAETLIQKNSSDSSAIIPLQKAISLLHQKNYPLTESYINYILAKTLYNSNQLARSVEHMLFAREIVPNGDYNLLPFAGSFLSFLGSLYCMYGEFQLGLQYLTQSRQYQFCSSEDLFNMHGNLGLAYYKLNNADSSVWASSTALKIAYQMNDSTEIGSMLGNLGAAYLLRKNYDSAIIFLQKDFDINSNLQQWSSALAALLFQTKAYYLQNENTLAYRNLQIVDSIFNFCKCEIPSALEEYYKQLSKHYRLQNNFQSAIRFQDSFIKYQNIATNINNSSTFKNLELGVVGRMHETKMKFLESEKKRQVLTRNVIVVLSIFTVIIIFLLLYVQWKRRKVDRHIFQIKMNNAEVRLKAYLENIKTKNNLLDQLNEELERLRQSRAEKENNLNDENDEIEILAKIKNASLITEEGWLEFTELVELVHRHFFTRLHKHYPELTPAEIRTLTLIKLNFNIKEMAGMLGISPDSVRKAKQRLRKKLNLSDTESLEEIVMNI